MLSLLCGSILASIHDYWKKTTCAQSLSHVRLFATPWTVARQAPLSMGTSPGKNTGVGCHALPGDLPNPGIEPMSPALQVDSLLTELPGKPGKSVSSGRFYFLGF